MNPFLKAALVSLSIASPLAMAPVSAATTEDSVARGVAEDLLAADRGFAAEAAGKDTVTALADMFHEDVVMPLPEGRFARGRAAVVEALRANPFNAQSRAQWTPVRAGVSADGQHGFTFGYMTLTGNDGSVRLAKYLAYWVRTPQGWRAAAYKRAPRPEGEVSLDVMAPSLPVRIVAENPDSSVAHAHRQSLIAAENAFAAEAQRIGLGPAFRRNGRDDAVNVGGEAAFAVGAETIARFVGGDSPESPVNWGADDALVASSGDLGITFGVIRPNGPPPEGRPAASSFFTIWRRDLPDGRWLYIAE